MRLTLKCLVTGNPKPDLTWLKDGKTIAENIENLVIENVSMKNTGNYICKAVNVFGTQEAFTKINVIGEACTTVLGEWF